MSNQESNGVAGLLGSWLTPQAQPANITHEHHRHSAADDGLGPKHLTVDDLKHDVAANNGNSLLALAESWVEPTQPANTAHPGELQDPNHTPFPATTHAVKETISNVEEKVQPQIEKVQAAASHGKEAMQAAGEKVAEKASEGAQAVRSYAQTAAHKVHEGMDAASTKAAGMAHNVKEKAQAVGHSALEQAKHGYEATKDTLGADKDKMLGAVKDKSHAETPDSGVSASQTDAVTSDLAASSLKEATGGVAWTAEPAGAPEPEIVTDKVVNVEIAGKPDASGVKVNVTTVPAV